MSASVRAYRSCHLVEDVLHVQLVVLEVPEHFVEQGAVLDDEQMSIKNARVLGAD
jgi:hypothetical protein